MQKWKELLQASLCQAADLAERCGWDEEKRAAMEAVIARYPMLVNPYYLNLIDFSDPADPIRHLAIPDLIELDQDGQVDTSGEMSSTVMPGLQHKYPDTAIILSTDRCAMYCRHCFRKRFVGVDSSPEMVRDIRAIAGYIREKKEIRNVLISGGDAFLNSNAVLQEYLEQLCEIPHLDFIRFGTHVPVSLPQRITGDRELCRMLTRFSRRKQLYVVTQFNHPRELTEEAIAAIRQLWELDIAVLNQSVLLKGVNDDPETIHQLLRGLTAWAVIPYYIFQCRPAQGVKNEFQVPLLQAWEIMRQARQGLDGPGASFRFILAHKKGKLELLGPEGGEMLFRYHHCKDPELQSRIFRVPVTAEQCWID